jgi:hypothetical protein
MVSVMQQPLALADLQHQPLLTASWQHQQYCTDAGSDPSDKMSRLNV